MGELQDLADTIQNLQHRLGRLNADRTEAGHKRARCHTELNRLKNIQAGRRDQNDNFSQRLRSDITMWENRFRTASTQSENARQSYEDTGNRLKSMQARLDRMQEEKRRRMAAMPAARGRGGGHRSGR